MQPVEHRARRELTANGRRLRWSQLTRDALLDPDYNVMKPAKSPAGKQVHLGRESIDALRQGGNSKR